MSFALIGTGGLFTRWGAIGKRSLNIFTQIGSAFLSQVNTIQNQYESAQQDQIQDLYPALFAYQQTPDFVTFSQTMMENTIIAMARDDAAPTLPNDVPTNLTRLINQMLGSGDSIAKPTVGSSVTAGGSNHGTGFLMGTTAQGAMVNPLDGLAYDYSFVETITWTCTDDAIGGSGTINQEPWGVVGFPNAVDNLNYAWPAGSGTNTSGTTVNPDSTSANLLTNGNFNTFTVANVPDGWTITVGTPGTTVKRNSSPLRSTNTNNLQIVGNGAELTTLQQTLTNLSANTTYAVNCWVKQASAAAGVFRIRLMDGTNTINDNAGTANAVSRNASSMTGNYVALNVFFRTPKFMPPTIKLEIALTTALTNAATIDITDLVLTPADQSYIGGPFTKVIPGATQFGRGDTLTIATTNTATTSQFCRLVDQFFNLREANLRIPSVGGGLETVHDSLIA